MADAMKAIDFYPAGDYLNCYGSDALLVARALGLVRLTVDERHATAQFPAGTAHTCIPVHAMEKDFAELRAQGWEPQIVGRPIPDHATEQWARVKLWNAAQYLYKNQLGDPARVKAMDILDDIRRDSANWHDLARAHNVEYRDYPVFRPE